MSGLQGAGVGGAAPLPLGARRATATALHISGHGGSRKSNNGINDNGLFAPVDSEATPDGIADYRDTDSDGDGALDSAEAGNITTAPPYAAPDGSVSTPLTTRSCLHFFKGLFKRGCNVF